ncbi:MAG: type II toxin-antitoxin system HicA family toxin [Desulfobacterales bacterium]|nr:type II toxin-antitoxin system HicA family toxin [Desulfobacterales bacterium]MDD4073410.1 type II toxin-antitoxin system HicA family toxin [Desulfobacterales bacterium]MDD4391584.1 type II toxin-antitoxin system HicA family toxin [Desulfobacterales bacterium]
MKTKQLISKLKSLGVEITKGRGKGGHQLARYKDKQATIPIHGDADIGPIFIKMICKQLDINPDKIL